MQIGGSLDWMGFEIGGERLGDLELQGHAGRLTDCDTRTVGCPFGPGIIWSKLAYDSRATHGSDEGDALDHIGELFYSQEIPRKLTKHTLRPYGN